MNFWRFNYSILKNISRQYYNHDQALSTIVVYFWTALVRFLHFMCIQGNRKVLEIEEGVLWDNNISYIHSKISVNSEFVDLPQPIGSKAFIKKQ